MAIGPAGVKLVEQLCQRLRVPNDLRDLAKLVAEYHDSDPTPSDTQPKLIVSRLTPLIRRKPQRVEQIALTSEADVRGRTGFEASDYPQGAGRAKPGQVAQAVPTKRGGWRPDLWALRSARSRQSDELQRSPTEREALPEPSPEANAIRHDKLPDGAAPSDRQNS